jgi:glycosyltransferase involved in cell wall biosynthesis
MTAAALDCEGVAIKIVNISNNVLARQNDNRFEHLYKDDADYRANIFHINADQLPIVLAQLGNRRIVGKYNIAYPAWELSTFPDEWVPHLSEMNEIWAPSRFIQSAIAAKIDKPVIHMPLGVELAEGYEQWTRTDFKIPKDAFVCLFHFDFASYASRKNPWAVIEAFQRAFDEERAVAAEPILVIKAISAERFKDAYQQLLEAIGNDSRVRVIAETLSADQMHGLVNCADVFVSLHRSEGFGRGPAEAMRLGKAVVATGYSGNLDYMNESNSFLIPYRLKPISADEYPFANGQVWAEPDIDATARILRRLANTPSLVGDIGSKAAEFMSEYHSKNAVGAKYAERLRNIGAF